MSHVTRCSGAFLPFFVLGSLLCAWVYVSFDLCFECLFSVLFMFLSPIFTNIEKAWALFFKNLLLCQIYNSPMAVVLFLFWLLASSCADWDLSFLGSQIHWLLPLGSLLWLWAHLISVLALLLWFWFCFCSAIIIPFQYQLICLWELLL